MEEPFVNHMGFGPFFLPFGQLAELEGARLQNGEKHEEYNIIIGSRITNL